MEFGVGQLVIGSGDAFKTDCRVEGLVAIIAAKIAGGVLAFAG